MFTNLHTIKDAVMFYDDRYKKNKSQDLLQNIKIKKIDNIKISIMNKEYTKIVEKNVRR